MNSSEIINDVSILIVEDETELREYLKEYLEIFFKKVYIAKCGESGYKQYLDKKPDIILSDINMPNLDGLSMIKRIRKDDNQTQIIIMSAYSEREKLLQAIELELVTYLMKPINSQKLKDVLFDTVEKLKKTKKILYFENDLHWDIFASSLYKGSKNIALKEKETMLLKLLCSQPNHIFTTKEIFKYIYCEQKNKEFSEYSITSFIKRLRAKLPDDLIHNEYGSGYKVAVKE